jgi:hypothetical protein
VFQQSTGLILEYNSTHGGRDIRGMLAEIGTNKVSSSQFSDTLARDVTQAAHGQVNGMSFFRIRLRQFPKASCGGDLGPFHKAGYVG